ncbi:glutamate synthase, partial [Candidatus Endoriftia persephone str. Guaymas]|nr:glutamate synthase [Candidatus Endoriftia persephone str. Guaymas]
PLPGSGRRPAVLDGYLRGKPYQPARKHPLVDHEKLHLWYRTNAPQREQQQLPLVERMDNFDEILQGLNEGEAQFEAQRCLSCGNCFECDGCLGSCPEGAVIKLGPGKRYRYDYSRCTGCAVC